MKTSTLIFAAFVSAAAIGAVSSVSAADANAAPDAQFQQNQTRLAGWFEDVGDHDDHGERRHHRRLWDDDDDDGEHRGRRHGEHHGDRDHHGDRAGRGGENRPADPNAANAPLPDNGVFNGKARPKVEVQ